MQTATLHTLFSSESNEWYTPSIYVEAARAIMGGIDLDPASCAEANEVVRATHYYAKEQDGLTRPFFGRVWLNPPFGIIKGKSSAGLWTKKLLSEYRAGRTTQAVLLVNANTDTFWFHQLYPFPICFTQGRVNFLAPKQSGIYRVGNTHGSAFVYLGPHIDQFAERFSAFGQIEIPFTSSSS